MYHDLKQPQTNFAKSKQKIIHKMETTTITIVRDEEGFSPIIEKWNEAVRNLRIATAADWKNKPMSQEKHYVILTDIVVPSIAMERIRQGHIPMQMEDRWFMFCEGNAIRYFRSWTGYNTFNAYFEQKGGSYHITKIEVDMEDYNSNPRRAVEALDCFLTLLAMQCGVDMDELIGITENNEVGIVQPEEDSLSMKDRFFQYMSSKRSESTAKAYVSTLDNPVRQFIHDIVDPNADSIFSFTTAEDVKGCIEKLNAAFDYIEANKAKHRIMSAALSNYLKFMEQQ